MSKTLIYWIIGAVVVVGGGGYAFTQIQGANTSLPATDASSGQSLASLVDSGVSQKCTFNNEVVNSSSSGTVYIGGGKVRGDFVSVAAGHTYDSHMVSDGTTIHTWIDGMSTGYKMAVSAQASEETGSKEQQGVDMQAKLDYQCTPWSVDASVFALPSGVTFTDMNEMMHGAMPSASGSAGASAGSSANCAMCDQAGPGRDQCRAALGCK